MNGTLNKIMLIGYLGDKVKLHYFDSGNCVGKFSLATNEVYVNKHTNEKTITTEWHNIVVKNATAELCEKHLSKGDRIYVEGKIKTRQWQGSDGSPKTIVEIHVTDFTFLTPRNMKLEARQGSDSDSSLNNEDKKNRPRNDLPF